MAEGLRGLDVRHQRQAGAARRDGARPRRCCARASASSPRGGVRRARGSFARGRRRRGAAAVVTRPDATAARRRCRRSSATVAGLWSLSALSTGCEPRRERSRTGLDRRRLLLGGAASSAAAGAVARVAGRLLGGRATPVAPRPRARRHGCPHRAGPGRRSRRGVELQVAGHHAVRRAERATSTGSTPPSSCPQLRHGGLEAAGPRHGRPRGRRSTGPRCSRQADASRRLVTLTCVSNEVGGDLIGNAVWTGWPIARAARAWPARRPTPTWCSRRSVDGFTAGTPLAGAHRRPRRAARRRHERRAAAGRARVPGADGRARPLRLRVGDQVGRRPQGHPVRPRDVAYWTPRGWSATGPIKTASRIDVPAGGRPASRRARVAVAGVAWAQHRGISKVEVRVDDGPWQPAPLAAEPTHRHLAAVGLRVGRDARAATPCRCAPTDGDGRGPDRAGGPAGARTAPPAGTPSPSPRAEPTAVSSVSAG